MHTLIETITEHYGETGRIPNSVFEVYGFLEEGISNVKKKKILFVFLGPHLQHMEVPRLGVESEL